MKHLIILIIILLCFSCKKELPSPIKAALLNYNGFATSLNEVDSAIWVMTPEEIKKTSDRSLKLLLDRSERLTQLVRMEDSTLNELLKHNPEFSDYVELNSKVLPFYKSMNWEEGGGKVISNKNLMRKRVSHHVN